MYIYVVLQVQSLQCWRLHALVRQQSLKGVPGVGESVEVEGVFGQAKLHIVFGQCPPFTFIQHLGLLVCPQAVQPLQE